MATTNTNEETLQKILIELQNNNAMLKRANSTKWTFLRGVVIGFGSIIGGTIVVSIALWFLSTIKIVPFVGNVAGDTLQFIQENYQSN